MAGNFQYGDDLAKTLTLKLAGLWTSPNDYTTRDGALDVANNIVIDQTDLGQSRRGFEIEIDNAANALIDGYLLKSFTATDPNASSYDLLTYRYAAGGPSGLLLVDDADTLTGDTEFLPPSPCKVCRMLNWGKYIYVAADTGIKRVSPANSTSEAAGIPQALDVVLSLTGSSGYLVPNETASITADRTSASATLNKISTEDIAQVTIGQVLSGTGIPVGTTVLSITNSAPVVIYSSTLTAGSAVIVVPSAASLVVGQIVTGEGIPENTRIAPGGIAGLNITLTNTVIQTGTQNITFSSDNTITMSANATSGAPTTTTVTVSDGTQVAYRMIWGFQNENNGTTVGAPSGFVAITNATGESRNVVVNATIPEGITTDYFYQIYRSPQTVASTVVPPDQMQLVVEGLPSNTDISNGYIQITDQTPDSLKGESLYTGSDVEGISQANYPPPIAVDMCVFRDHTVYLNFTLEHQLKLAIDGVGGSDGVDIGDDITFTSGLDSFVVTGAATEDIAAGEFAVVTTGTPAQNIADTAASFIRVVNRYTSNELVYAYLLSGPNELPGQMLIQARTGVSEFTVLASANATAWTPNLDPAQASTADNQKNSMLVSKNNQPEAVPRVNLFRAGGIGNEILRGIALRDYTIILTTGGVYRLTGQTVTDFICEPFDLTVVCVAPETAVALGNECWALTTQGVASISDGGVRLRSALQINSELLALIRRAPNSVRDVSFAVGYETDQRYILALPNEENDTTCSFQYCYNYVTDRWTIWTRDCTAGYVNTTKGLYLGNAENTNVVKERKNGNYTDYADESFEVDITSFSGLEVTLASVSGITVGDILWQDLTAGIVFSEIVAINVPANVVTVNDIITWDPALSPASKTRVYTAIDCAIQWKPNAAGDPSEAKQFSEGQIVFRSPRFATSLLQFATDVYGGFQSVTVAGTSGAFGWGQFPWGNAPWGGDIRPRTLRFYIPQNTQYGGSLITKMTIRSAYSAWQLEGIQIVAFDIGFELGGEGNE